MSEMKTNRPSSITESQIKALEEILPAEKIKLEEPMARHTTFRIGGPAEAYLMPSTKEELRDVMQWVHENAIPYFLIGNGSDLLVGDLGMTGAVISLKDLKGCTVEGHTLTVLAGTSMHMAAQAAEDNSLKGMEFASGIPGSIGGGVFMNAGAYGGEMKQVLTSVRVLMADGSFSDIPAKDLDLAYRHSTFMADTEENRRVIVSATMELEDGNQQEIHDLSADYNQRRRDKQPLEFPSAGSTFKRPEGYFAGKLISDAGLRGYRVGDAQVSEKHAGFCINRGTASAQDMMDLIHHVQSEVKAQFGVDLEPEVRLVGYFR